MLRSKRVDGLIVTSSRVGALYLEYLERIDVPIVLVNNHNEQSGRYTFSISVDNRDGGYLATRHLIEVGHRRIAYITGPADHSDDAERLKGYRTALEENAIRFDTNLVVSGNGRLDGGEQALQALTSLDAPPSAAFCYNDMTAIGLISAAWREGIAVPGDLAVVGFDDIPLASRLRPSLTTIAQPKRDMGRQAMQMVLALLRAEPSAKPLSDILVQGELIVRESSEFIPA